MATGFEDLGAVPVQVQSEVSNDFSDLGAVPVKASNVPRRFSVNRPQLTPEQKFIQAQQAGPLTKFGTSVGDLLESLIVRPVQAIGGVTSGLSDIVGEASTQPQTLQSLLLQGGPFGSAATPVIAQNLAEAGTRGLFDLGSSVNELISRAVEHPIDTISSLSPLAGIAKLLPRTPTSDELNQFIADQNKARGVQSVLSQPLLPEVLGKTNVQLANDLETVGTQVLPLVGEAGPALRVAGRTVEAIPGALAKPFRSAATAIENRGILRQPLPAATTEALGITPIEGSQNIVPVVKSSVIEANGGKLPTGPITQKTLKDASDFKINQYIDGLKVADEQGLKHSTSSLEDAMRSHLESIYPTYDQAQIDSIIQSVRDGNAKLFSQEYVSPVEGQKIARQINLDVNNKNPNRIVKSNEQLNAETALSQELSRQGSEMYQAATGTYGTPNQDWGVLKQAQEGLTGELKTAQRADAGRTPGGEVIPTTLTGLLTKGARRVGGRAFISTNAEDVLSSLGRTLKEGEARPRAGAIDPSQQQAIFDRYTPATPSNIIPAELPPMSLDDQVKELLPRLPKEIRTEKVARRIIEQQTAP